MPSSSTPRRSARQVNLLQAIALLGTFLLLAGVGGLLTAGLALPLAAGASTVTTETEEVFDNLPSELEPGPLSEQSTILDKDGKLLATIYIQNRVVVSLDEISRPMQDAVVAIEDKRFFAHGGVDVEGMGRAIVINSFTDKKQGASTLTQQYVKNVLIEEAMRNDDKLGVAAARNDTLERKLREAKLAIAIEKKLSKLEILERYLNIAQFGNTVYGVESAARYYFGKSAKDLNVVEAATIAGITKAPNKYDPSLSPKNATDRRNLVLNSMYQQGFITKEELDTSRATPIEDTLHITPLENGCEAAGGAGYFCDYVTKVILNDPVFGETKADRRDLLTRGGLTIHTTLDSKLQKAANKELRASIPAKDPSGIATALTSVEPGTGKIVVMAQNRKFVANADDAKVGQTTVNYSADQAHGGSRGFPAGSTFKTFVLAEWLKSGRNLSEMVDANKTTWKGDSWTASCIPDFGAGRGDYTPSNSDGDGRGMKSVLQATAFSINTAYMSMENQLDLCAIADTAYQVGFRPSLSAKTENTANDEGVEIAPSMALGVQNTSPLSQAAAYATFASGGTYCEPIAITSVTLSDGSEMPVPSAGCRTVVDGAVAAGVNHALQGVINGGGATNARLAGGRVAAGKTGTAQNNYHTWFVGYTPQLSTAVWVGHPDRNVAMQGIWINGQGYRRVYGSTIAAPTWRRFMDTALTGAPNQAFPVVSDKVLNGVKVALPRVWGQSVAAATAMLEEAGFTVRVDPTQVHSSSPAGTVAYTMPSGYATSGALVTLRISNGTPEPREEPEATVGDGNGNDDDRTRGRERGDAGDNRDNRQNEGRRGAGD